MRAIIGICLTLLCLAGCGDSGPAGSCKIAAASAAAGMQCIDFSKGYSASSAMQTCSQGGANATYSSDACATTGRVGHCTLSSPDGAFTQVASYYPPSTAADAMTACTAAGGMFAAN